MTAPNPDLRAWLASLEQIGIKLGLDRIRALAGRLGDPQSAFPSVIVAGTNGKGSVAAMVERGLRATGCRTGRYTSPHLIRLEERFAIDGAAISPAALDAALRRVRDAARVLPNAPSYFEATTAAAFEAFRDQGVEIAVLEVGLGGRLDATNIASPVAGAITAIALDHEQFLGGTVELVAREKAGVVKPGMVVVLAENSPPVEAVIEARCAAVGARLVPAMRGTEAVGVITRGVTELSLTTPHRGYAPMRMALRGRHQIANAVTAVRLLEELPKDGRPDVGHAAIRAAVEEVSWRGRLELGRWRGLEVLIDGAHNPAGAGALAAYLSEAYGRRLPMVVGMMRDKDLDAILAALAPAAAAFAFTAPATTRAAVPEDLRVAAGRIAPSVAATAWTSTGDALTHAASLGSPVVVAGSLYLAGEILADLP